MGRRVRLNYVQMWFVQDAVPGNDDAGFAEALVGVDGEWRGIQVEAMPKEKQVINFDPTEQERSSLPGVDDEHGTPLPGSGEGG
ncbi:hypothetical protein PNP83_00870 [Halobacterium salinarum]|nr:hypothetical protein [Halobacterium salinarum]MDL0143562.1 hypothetical protein [Halobacterium salinarum]